VPTRSVTDLTQGVQALHVGGAVLQARALLGRGRARRSRPPLQRGSALLLCRQCGPAAVD